MPRSSSPAGLTPVERLDRGEGAAHAARLFGAAEALREALGAPLAPFDRAKYQRDVAAARTALGEEAFAAAWDEGRAMPLEQAVADVLKDASPYEAE